MAPEEALNAGSGSLDANYTNPASIRPELSSSNIKKDRYLKIADILLDPDNLSARRMTQHTATGSRGLVGNTNPDGPDKALHTPSCAA